MLSGDFATGLDLVADVLLNPAFPAPALEREREVQLAGIRAQKDHLLQSASRAMRRALFGEIGYGLDALGSEASVQRIQVADLKAFHKKLARPGNCVLAIYGDIKAAEVRTQVQEAFAAWEPGPAVESQNSPPLPALSRRPAARSRNARQEAGRSGGRFSWRDIV